MKTGPKPRPEAERFFEKVEKTDACWLWKGQIVRAGYGSFNVGGHHSKKAFAHRWSYEYANGPIPDGLCIRHSCDTPACVNPAHLSLGTKRENSQDMMERKRYNERRIMLTQKKADVIRLEAKGRKYGDLVRLCKEYSISLTQLYRVLRGESWTLQ